jgi:hypothetical protein
MGRFKNALNFMKEILCVLFLLISLTSFSQELQSPDRILTYGFPYDTQRKAIKFVGKKWGIELYTVADCVVSKKLIDSVETIHTKLWKKMDSIHGVDSEKRFRNEVIAEMKKIEKVNKIFERDRNIKKLLRKIERAKRQASPNLEDVSDDGNIYYWTVNSFEINYSSEFRSKHEFMVRINLAERKTEIIEAE